MIDHKRITFLRACSELSNDEWGEGVTGLLAAYDQCSYASDEFKAALEKELLGELEWAEASCKIVTRTITNTVTFQELEVDEE